MAPLLRAALLCLSLSCVDMVGSQSAKECIALGHPRNASAACLATHRKPTRAISSRPAHYVQRTGDLLSTLVFLAELGMRILRHEENEQACPITCNGAFENPWSKTMVGTLTEDRAYALELTHNYGVAEYETGRHRSLVNFGIVVADPVAVAQAAGSLGYFTAPLPPVGGVQAGWLDASLDGTMLVIGPDDYYYTLMPAGEAAGPSELLPRFHHISLRVSSLHHSLQFYTKLLGMRQLSDEGSAARSVGVATASLLEGRPEAYAESVMSTAVGYRSSPSEEQEAAAAEEDVVLVLIDDGLPVTRTEWGGRNAIAVPEAAVRQINALLLEQQEEDTRQGKRGGTARGRGRIVHPMQTIEEKLGLLLILILADPDGNEVCLVSRETFEPASAAADDFQMVSVSHVRSQILRAYSLRA
jgi:catechol 2,3-dioxygenase-like lactoylglutathione lyase family enzyme